MSLMNELTPLSVTDAEAEARQDDADSIWVYWVSLTFPLLMPFFDRIDRISPDLVVAVLLEVAGTTAMKMSDGLTKLLPSIAIYVFYGLSFAIFPLSLKRIELSTAYAFWSGLGTTVTCIIGFVYFNDSINWVKIVALTAITAGCVVLNFADDIEKIEEGTMEVPK